MRYICYRDESIQSEFNTCIKSLKRYNMLAYKKLIFEYQRRLISGEVLGDRADGKYILKLPTDKVFESVYGSISLVYEIEDNRIYYSELTPKSLWLEGNRRLLDTYCGIVYTNLDDLEKIRKVIKGG